MDHLSQVTNRVRTGSEKSMKTVLAVKNQGNWAPKEKSVKSQQIWLVDSENDMGELNLIPKWCEMCGPQINMLLISLAKGTVFTIHTISQFYL